MSAGEQRRIMIGRALVASADMLLLDEPPTPSTSAPSRSSATSSAPRPAGDRHPPHHPSHRRHHSRDRPHPHDENGRIHADGPKPLSSPYPNLSDLLPREVHLSPSATASTMLVDSFTSAGSPPGIPKSGSLCHLNNTQCEQKEHLSKICRIRIHQLDEPRSPLLSALRRYLYLLDDGSKAFYTRPILRAALDLAAIMHIRHSRKQQQTPPSPSGPLVLIEIAHTPALAEQLGKFIPKFHPTANKAVHKNPEN